MSWTELGTVYLISGNTITTIVQLVCTLLYHSKKNKKKFFFEYFMGWDIFTIFYKLKEKNVLIY